MERKQVLERETGLSPSARLCLPLCRVEESERQKQKCCTGQRPAQSKVLAGQELGPLTKLGRLGGASVPVKPCQHPHFPQSSAETRLVVLGAAAKHLPASHRDDIIWNPLFAPLRRGVEEQGWRSRGLSRAL